MLVVLHPPVSVYKPLGQVIHSYIEEPIEYKEKAKIIILLTFEYMLIKLVLTKAVDSVSLRGAIGALPMWYFHPADGKAPSL